MANKAQSSRTEAAQGHWRKGAVSVKEYQGQQTTADYAPCTLQQCNNTHSVQSARRQQGIRRTQRTPASPTHAPCRPPQPWYGAICGKSRTGGTNPGRGGSANGLAPESAGPQPWHLEAGRGGGHRGAPGAWGRLVEGTGGACVACKGEGRGKTHVSSKTGKRCDGGLLQQHVYCIQTACSVWQLSIPQQLYPDMDIPAETPPLLYTCCAGINSTKHAPPNKAACTV
jgi:hypothetical protein